MVRRCLITKGKYGKVRDTEIRWSTISKSVIIIIFVEFNDQLIDYRINCASLTIFQYNRQQRVSAPGSLHYEQTIGEDTQ